MGKDRPSKDKRQARNRARREALEARREAARERAKAGATASGGDGDAPRRGLVSRLLNPTPKAAKGDAERDRPERAAPVRGRPDGPVPRNDRGQVPGHHAALFALFFAVASVGLLLFVPIPIEKEIDSPADAEPGCEIDDDELADFEQAIDDADDAQLTCVDSSTVPSELGAVAYPILAIPLAITGVAFWATTRERQSRIWTGCLVAFAVFIVFFAVGGLLLVPSMIALTVASFQGRRAEQKLLIAQRGAAGGDDRVDGDVIETTATDGQEDEDGPADDD